MPVLKTMPRKMVTNAICSAIAPQAQQAEEGTVQVVGHPQPKQHQCHQTERTAFTQDEQSTEDHHGGEFRGEPSDLGAEFPTEAPRASRP